MQERYALDPVCGMTVEIATAAVRTTREGVRYHFCATACHDRFMANPLRYLGEGMETPPEPVDGESAEAPVRIRECPGCAAPVRAVETEAAIMGRLTMTEYATLVRQNWRRRLGRRAYDRHHSSRLIRALALHAMRPESPVSSMALEEELSLEVARLRAEGLNRPQVQRELYHLSRAAVDVLMRAGLPVRQKAAMTETMDRRLLALLEWPNNRVAKGPSMAEPA